MDTGTSYHSSGVLSSMTDLVTGAQLRGTMGEYAYGEEGSVGHVVTHHRLGEGL